MSETITCSADSKWLLQSMVIRYCIFGYRRKGEMYFSKGEYHQDMRRAALQQGGE